LFNVYCIQSTKYNIYIGGAVISRVPLRDEVYQRVLAQVQLGELPGGSRVRDVALAAQLGVSRTPVREALLRLVREGVLDTSLGRGFRVRPLDPGELKDVGEILGGLESLALRLSPAPAEPRRARLLELDRRLEQTRGDVPRCLDLEDDWHRALLEECPNRRLLELVLSLRQIPRRYLAAYMREAGRSGLSTLPHAKILQALTDAGADSGASVFEQQWKKGVAELVIWTERRPASQP
jgi:DNA-binding GntR family transcriptional regulator